jgi:hypothetical protein
VPAGVHWGALPGDRSWVSPNPGALLWVRSLTLHVPAGQRPASSPAQGCVFATLGLRPSFGIPRPEGAAEGDVRPARIARRMHCTVSDRRGLPDAMCVVDDVRPGSEFKLGCPEHSTDRERAPGTATSCCCGMFRRPYRAENLVAARPRVGEDANPGLCSCRPYRPAADQTARQDCGSFQVPSPEGASEGGLERPFRACQFRSPRNPGLRPGLDWCRPVGAPECEPPSLQRAGGRLVNPSVVRVVL